MQYYPNVTIGSGGQALDIHSLYETVSLIYDVILSQCYYRFHWTPSEYSLTVCMHQPDGALNIMSMLQSDPADRHWIFTLCRERLA